MTVYRGEQTGSPVLAWAKEVRHKDEDIAEPAGPAKTLKNLYTQQCQLDRTPSYAADLADHAPRQHHQRPHPAHPVHEG